MDHFISLVHMQIMSAIADLYGSTESMQTHLIAGKIGKGKSAIKHIQGRVGDKLGKTHQSREAIRVQLGLQPTEAALLITSTSNCQSSNLYNQYLYRYKYQY